MALLRIKAVSIWMLMALSTTCLVLKTTKGAVKVFLVLSCSTFPPPNFLLRSAPLALLCAHLLPPYILGMEGSALQDFLDWAANSTILSKISIVCCDRDSSTHKLIADDPRCDYPVFICSLCFGLMLVALTWRSFTTPVITKNPIKALSLSSLAQVNFTSYFRAESHRG